MCTAWPTEGQTGVTVQHMNPLAHKDSLLMQCYLIGVKHESQAGNPLFLIRGLSSFYMV